MEGLSIGDLLVIEEVQRKDYGRSPGLSRALASMGITDIHTHLTQKSEVHTLHSFLYAHLSWYISSTWDACVMSTCVNEWMHKCMAVMKIKGR